ncbi:MAG TPA: O-antigen ligase family protein [Gemmatimonadales bacterium]|nr:O-antigen ligase family protein [Gemmatimonadales bacterium]
MAVALVALLLRSIAGPVILLASLAVLLAGSRRMFLLATLLTLPISTLAWDVPITEIAGRTLDIRLLLTFGIASLIALALVLERPRPTRLEWLGIAFVAWIGVAGLLSSDSVYIVAPAAARWFSYVGVFMLARRTATSPEDRSRLVVATALGFLVPSVLGLVEFVVGDASFMNGAVRATAPGGRGPIGLAFAGQMLLLLGFALARMASQFSGWWWALAAAATLAVIASATRIVTVTAWLAVAGVAAVFRRWRMVAVATVLFVVALGARPDLLNRYFTTVTAPSPSAQPSDPQASPAPGEEGEDQDIVVDASLRFRFFVWGVLVTEWSERPLIGIGPGMTAAAVEQVSGLPRTAPHNDYLAVLGEMGVIGLAVFLALQASVLWALYGTWRREAGERKLLVASLGSLFVATNILGALNNPMYFYDVQVPLWALVGSVTGPVAAGTTATSSLRRAAADAEAG